ncbi:hypothetical protein [Streptomyces sp. G45]|uniref:hypothetical protein n=1 Tax=Streptomyces sp. G45 TaxID=3406627 RepID=UPI003C1E67B8
MTNALSEAIGRAETALTDRIPGGGSPLAGLTDAALADIVGRDPASVEDACYLAALLQALRRHDDARRILRTAAASLPASPGTDITRRAAALNRLSVRMASLGALEEASHWLRQAIQTIPASAPALLHARTHANLASVHAQREEFRQAAVASQRARQYLGPGNDAEPVEALDVRGLLAAVDAALARSANDRDRLSQALGDFRGSSRGTLTHPAADADEGRRYREISALTARAALEFDEARSTRSQPRLEQLTGLFETLASKSAATLGADHPQTVAVLLDLACAEFETARGTGDLDRLERAAHTLGAAAGRAAQCFGEGHPLTHAAVENRAIAAEHLALARASSLPAAPGSGPRSGAAPPGAGAGASPTGSGRGTVRGGAREPGEEPVSSSRAGTGCSTWWGAAAWARCGGRATRRWADRSP